MSEATNDPAVVYQSHAVIHRQEGPVRTAYLAGEERPVTYSVHGAIAAHYGLDEPAEHHAATIDHVVGAVAG